MRRTLSWALPRTASLLSAVLLPLIAGPAGRANSEPVLVEPGWSLASRIHVPEPSAADLDPEGEAFWAISRTRGFRLSREGLALSVSGLSSLGAVLADAVAGGDTFWASTSTRGTVFRARATGGYTYWLRDFEDLEDHSFRAFASPPPGYSAGVVSPGQALLLDHGDGERAHRIWRFSLETPDSETLVWTDTIFLTDPRDLAIAASGVYIADSGGTGTGSFHRLRPSGSLARVPLAVPIAEPSALAVDPPSGDLLVADSATGTIFRLNPQTGAVTQVATGFSFPASGPGGAIDVSADGSRMVVSDQGAGLVYTFCSDGCAFVPICGNGVVETGEDCDDADIVDETCPRDCRLPTARTLKEAVTDFEFPREFGFYIRDLDHAVVSDGSLVFFWREPMDRGDDAIVTHWWSPEGHELTPPLMVREADVSGPLFSVPDLRGGFLASWREDRRKLGWTRMVQPLDGLGRLRPHELALPVGSDLARGSLGSAPWGGILAAGSSRVALRLGRQGGSLGAAFPFATSTESVSEPMVTGLPDGGFVIAWQLRSPQQGQAASWARFFAADGVPAGPEFAIAEAFKVTELEWSPRGELVALGSANRAWGSELWLQRVGLDGSLIGSPVLVYTAQRLTGVALGISPAGDVLTVWGESFFNREILSARPYRFDGAPMGPSVTLWDAGVGPRISNVSASGLSRRLHAGRGFAASWNYSVRGFGEMISVCEDTLPSCGNGALDHACEQCDNGAANADAVPDACRTTCTLARCGDGVLDGGEACDDGNSESCDGCSGSCELEPDGAICGDGIVSELCGESCDDGNLLAGDGCSPGCTLERIIGKPKKKSCILEFVVNNPTNFPYLDRRGSISKKQSCRDNDPRCDLDGGTPGSCTFQVRACVNNSNVPTCTPGRLDRVEIRSPRPSSSKPARTEAHAALSSALVALLGSTEANHCTDVIDVRVPLRGRPEKPRKGRMSLKVKAFSDDRRDSDKLKLTCLPPLTPERPVAFSTVWERVLSKGCAMCHNPDQDCCDFLDFTTAASAFATLGGVGREDCVGEIRVVPGNAEASLLYKKLIDPDVCGARMPARILFPEDFEDCRLGACLGAGETELIRRWINSGAGFN